MEFRAGFAGRKLERQQQSLMYSQLGGSACLPPGAPDLACSVCHKELRLLVQFVSGNAPPDVHRVVFVFMCDSRHYRESLRVYVHQQKLGAEVAQMQPQPATQGSKAAFTADSLLDLVSQMTGQAPQVVEEAKEPKAQAGPLFTLQTAEYDAFDAFTEAAADVKEQLALINQNYADSIHQIYRNIMYLTGPTHLCEQRCVQELRKGHFLQAKWNEDDAGDDAGDDLKDDPKDDSKGEEEDSSVFTKEVSLLPCECDACAAFAAQNAHELDIFGALIWKLKLTAAEFKAVFCFAPLFAESGWREGSGYAIRDEDDVSELLRDLQRRA